MDYLSLKAAVTEVGRKLPGSRITDAWQCGKNEIALVQRHGPGLVLSIDAVRPGLFLIERDQIPERVPSPFTDLMRARIKGTTVDSIQLPHPGERVVILTLNAAWPAKKGTPLQMVLEVMGRRSNLVLLAEGRILQPLRAVPREKSPARPLLAGDPYRFPPAQGGVPVEDVTADAIPDLKSKEDSRNLLARIRGLSPYTASQALTGVLQESPEGYLGAVPDGEAVFLAIRDMVASSNGKNGFLHYSGGKVYLSPFEPAFSDTSDTVKPFSTFSAAAVAWREAFPSEQVETVDEAAHLGRGLRERLERIDSALDHLGAEEERCHAHDEIRVMAEALLINAGLVTPGVDSVELPDPYDAAVTLTVPLNRTKNPQENANDLFGRAKRLKRGLEEVKIRRGMLEEEMEETRQALEALDERTDPEPARKLLGSTPRDTLKRGRGSQVAYSGPGRRHIVDGFTILVGKSSTDNEKVTFKAAGPNDLWLHARDYPGSHVVILTEKKKVPDRVLYEAAALAAAGSGAKNDTAPEIMVTERKWVRKLKGGQPGKVTVERFRTIRPRTDSLKSKAQRPKGRDRN